MAEVKRYYFNVIDGGKAYLEINWNSKAFEDDMVRLVVNDEKVVMSREDLETYMFLLTKNTNQYIKDKGRKMGVKYIPVPRKLYNEYLEYKKYKNK